MSEQINHIDVDALNRFAEAITQSPEKGVVRYKTISRWAGQTRVDAEVNSYIGGTRLPRTFSIASDEPQAPLGKDSAPNPQELLMAAMNACIIVGYVANASARGIKLEKLEIETTGNSIFAGSSRCQIR